MKNYTRDDDYVGDAFIGIRNALLIEGAVMLAVFIMAAAILGWRI